MSHSTCYMVARLGIALAVVMLVAGWATAADEPSPVPAATATPSPKEPVSAERINKLVKQLGDKDYYVRQRAQDELARLGFEAFDALNAATTDEDLEISSRAKYLLRLMRVEWTAEGDSAEVKRCLRDYEFQDGRSREARMQALAILPNGQGTSALCRLVRFEKSLPLSKVAAVALLSSQANADPPNAATVEMVRKALSDCKRPGAVWLLAWTRLGSEPDAVMSEWTKLIGDEQALLRPGPPQVNESNLLADTTPEIVAGLTRFQITRLKKLGKNEEAMAAIRRLVELETGNLETLAELLAWLTEQKAWKAVDDLEQRFRPQFAAEPGLLYLLAQAYAEQDEKDRAEETANRAFRSHPGKQPKELIHHMAAAQQLRSRGQVAWARREFEHVIKQGGDADNDELRAMAQTWLAEMLHDQGQDLDAAQTLEKLVEAIDAGKMAEGKLNGRRAGEVRARMNYFFACHWETKEDLAKRREYLDKALKADPADVDVLIAYYRLPEQTPEQHAKVVALIQKSATETREMINEDPESPVSYNQFAWLIANTEGDFDEALKFSLKSVELKPDEAGFYDTLARAYFAKGDLDNAVKSQTKAAELDRHSGLIRRQLDFFRKKQEEKKQP